MSTEQFMPGETVVARIKGDLSTYNEQRAAVAQRVSSRKLMFLTAYVIVIVAILAFIHTGTRDGIMSTFGIVVVVFGAIGTIFVYGLAMSPATKLQQSFRDYLIPHIYSFLENITYKHAATPTSYAHLPKQAIGTYNRHSFDDSIYGKHQGMGFEAYEARFAYKAGKSESEMFKGIVLAFQLERPFPGTLIATKAVGGVTRFMRDLFGSGGMQQVTTGNPTIDGIYEFRSDNPEAARLLVNPRFTQALDELQQAWPDASSRVAISHESGFVLLPTTKNFFELPKISVVCDYKLHIEPMVHDLAALLSTAALVRNATR